MNFFSPASTPRPSVLLASGACRDRGRGSVLLAVGAVLSLALLAGLSFTTGAASAAYPGTNGLIACSGPLGPNPPPPGGSFLEIFTMNDSGAMDANGNPTSQVRLTNNTLTDLNPRYSADGMKIAYLFDNNVWTMNADGSGKTQLTGLSPSPTNPGNLDSFVGGWSPDGSKIVFQRTVPAAGGNPANFEVFVINADGTGLTNLSNNPGNATTGNSDSQPSWSPDGTTIAFQSNRAGNPDIWLMPATGTDINGTGARNLTPTFLSEDSAPEYSPDGQQIAFQSDRGFVPVPAGQGRNLEIYRMSAADGSNVVRLTFNPFNPADTSQFLTSGFDLNPHWSPQGDRIVFHSGRDVQVQGQWDVFTIDSVVGEGALGAPALRLTARPLNDERCGWGVATPHILLSVGKAGSGTGTVTSGPAGIDCGADCAQGYAPGSTVTLTAAPVGNGSTFTGFTGGGCSGSDTTCTVTMDQAKTVTATFADTNPAVTVTKVGDGTGTVTSAPAGIDCGSDCTEEYASSTSVTLTATPSGNSTFSGFTGGACTGTGNTCTTTVDQAREVTASFSGPLLTVAKAGDGAVAGTVTSDPLGISCGVDCSEDYVTGTTVTLTATASTFNNATAATFAGFVGCNSTTGNTCTVTVDQAKTVTAVFVDYPTLTVNKTGAGTGTVTSAPTGISCGATCVRDFPKDSSVTLTAAPAAGSRFTGFTGSGCSGTATTCTVSMSQARTVTANFVLTRALTVTKSGSGSGTVTSTPVGVDCGSDCGQDYDDGTTVTLTANPAAGSTFTGFTGCASNPTPTTCTVTMDAVKTVTAAFTLIPRALSVTKEGSGTGTVTSSPTGIDCGSDCEGEFGNGTTVTLTANPADGSTFTGFTGAGCSGTGNTCQVTMDQAQAVVATFGVVPPATPTPPPTPTPAPPPAPTPTPPSFCPAGSSGDLTCEVSGGVRIITGTSGSDTIIGSSGDDVIRSGGGNDVIRAGAGNDKVDAGLGNDFVDGGSGNDQIQGGPAAVLAAATISVVGPPDFDKLRGSSGNDIIAGGRHDDRISGGTGADVLSGNAGNDVTSGDSGNDRVSGNDGNDRLSGNSGADRMSGGNGADRLSGGSSRDRLSGDGGSDRLFGDGSNDRLSGGRGNDLLVGGLGRDTLLGGPGRNRLIQ